MIKNKLITVEEYQRTVNESMSSINRKINQANLMVEFLEFINAPEQFYIARDLELDGPLGEIPSILNKAKTDDEKEDLKLIIFSNLAMKPQGDITRFIRKFKHIVDSDHATDFFEEQMDYAEKTAIKIEDTPHVDTKFINNELRADEDLQEQMKSSIEKFEIKSKKDMTRMKPIQDVQKCQLFLNNIDYRIVNTFDETEKDELLHLIKGCQESLNELKSSLKAGETI